jgi:sugar-specific transcriptional regulator TrmB
MEDFLSDLGLSKAEASVYRLLADMGSASASDIAKRSTIYRTNLYDILEQLRGRGLLTSYVQGRKRFYSISEPKTLQGMLDDKMSRLRTAEKELAGFISTVRRGQSQERKIYVYQDRKGLHFFYERLVDMAHSKDTVLVIGSSATILGVFNYYILNLSKRMKDIRIKVRMIANRDLVRNVVMRRIMSLLDMQLRLLPPGHVSPMAVFVFKGNVGFCNFMENPFVIVVEDHVLAKAYERHFEELWTMAKPA